MDVNVFKANATPPIADIVVVPFWKGAMKAGALELSKAILADFNGDKGQTLLLYQQEGKEPRILLLGMGDYNKATLEVIRSSFASAAHFCRSKKLKSINVVMPETELFSLNEVTQAVLEGIYLSNYAFLTHKSKPEEEAGKLIQTVNLMGANAKAAQQTAIICEAVHFARDLVNGNADDVTPEFLAQTARTLAKEHKSITAKIFDAKQIAKEGMGLLAVVGRGAAVEPRLIVLQYRGNLRSKDHTVLVGKGVTFDTGGLNIKPATSMEHQRSDMGGAAAVLGTLKAIAELGLKTNVTVVIPSAENSISSRSYKPGDVYHSYSGTTVEIGNTDAEGRLILADALSYAVEELKPTRIIDVATLTGAIIVALGDEVCGMMSNDDELAESLERAGEETYERVWRLPLVEEYRTQLKSERADLKNIGGGGAGSILAALFLQAFVRNVPWAHLDIAGTRYLQENKRYRSKGGTGMGVRLLVQYLREL